MDAEVTTTAPETGESTGADTTLAGVGVRYPDGVKALDGVTLALRRGEQVAIIGPSGAGKTTLLHTLGGAVMPTSGEVRMLGQDPWALGRGDRHRFRHRVFIAPQAAPLPPRQRVVHAVLAGRLPQWTAWHALRSLAHPRESAQAARALARFGLDDKLFLRSDRLSGGERQRVGLARMMLSDATLLLLDEPVSALDPALAHDALQTLQDEAHSRNATLVVSLHAVDLALARFGRIIGMRGGGILFDLQRAAVTDALLGDLYGRELGVAFQEPPLADVTRGQVTRCL